MGSGSTIRSLVKVLSSTSLEIPMPEPGLTRKQMDTGYTRLLAVQSTEVSGRMTFNMDMELKRMKKERNMRAISNTV